MSRIMSSGGSGIKSIQRGTITITSGNTTATATITAVVTANTRLKFLGCNDAGADAAQSTVARIALTNTTTITATVNTAPTANLIVAFEVVEYYTGVLKSMQRGTITVSAGTGSNTAAITSVDTTKSELTLLGCSVAASVLDLLRLALTSATVVTASNHVTSAGDATVGYEVAEYY